MAKFRSQGGARVHVLQLVPIAYQPLTDIARQGGGQLVDAPHLHLLLQDVLSSAVPRGGTDATEALATALLGITRLDDL